MAETFIGRYREKAQEIGKQGCSLDNLAEDLANYALDNNHSLAGVEIALTLAYRMIASQEISSSPKDVLRANCNLSFRLYEPA